MARSRANVVIFQDLQEVVEKLVAKYPIAFEEVDPARILYLKSDSKHSKKVASISAIKVPHPSVTPFKFTVTVFPEFDNIDSSRQVLHILRELRRIEDFEDGKVGKYPLQDFPEIVEKYGTTWEDRDDLDNPLDEIKPPVTTGIENV